MLYAGTEKFDKAIQPILGEYLKIHEAFATDKTEGVKKAAEQIVTLAGNVARTQLQESMKRITGTCQ